MLSIPPAANQSQARRSLPTRLGQTVVSLAVLCGAVVVLGLLPKDAQAHQVNVFVAVEGQKLRGEVYFRGGEPARQAGVSMFDPTGKKLGETTTDEEGKFTLETRQHCDLRIVANAGEGHGGEWTVKADELPSQIESDKKAETPVGGNVGLPQPTPSTIDRRAGTPACLGESVSSDSTAVPGDAPLSQAMVERAVARQVEALRRDLDRYQNRTRWTDIAGGLGYILGLFGLWALLRAKQDSGKARP